MSSSVVFYLPSVEHRSSLRALAALPCSPCLFVSIFSRVSHKSIVPYCLYQCRKDLTTFMDSYKKYPALSVHWIWVGPDGHAARPATGGVLPYYTMCSAEPDRHVKTIVNTFFLEGMEIHPHNFHYRFVPGCTTVLAHAAMFSTAFVAKDILVRADSAAVVPIAACPNSIIVRMWHLRCQLSMSPALPMVYTCAR